MFSELLGETITVLSRGKSDGQLAVATRTCLRPMEVAVGRDEQHDPEGAEDTVKGIHNRREPTHYRAVRGPLMKAGARNQLQGTVTDVVKGDVMCKVKVMVCGTCLDYYGLTEKLKVGINSNMYDIADEFLAADKVITL